MKYAVDEEVFIGCLSTLQVYRGKIVKAYLHEYYDAELHNGKFYKFVNEDHVHKSFEEAKKGLIDWQIHYLLDGQKAIARHRETNETLHHNIRVIQETVHEAV